MRYTKKFRRRRAMAATYYAIVATEQTRYYVRGVERYGMDWTVIAGPCPTSQEAETQGKAWIEEHEGGNRLSMTYQTMHRNLTIVSKSALRQYRVEVSA